MHEGKLHRARIVSSVAATVISLACGTNYVYSAWAPQFADKLQLSATQSNLIGLSANLGMYSLGAPVGMFVDGKGPRPAVAVGAVLLGLGYFPLQQAFVAGAGAVPALCFFSFLTGLGGCMAFAAAVKTSALNWPHHRGTATAFPLAAFGLSAFFFSVLGSIAFTDNTAAFLLLLALGTVCLILLGFCFLRVLPHGHPAAAAAPYDALPTSSPDAIGIDDDDDDSLAAKAASRKSRRGTAARSEPGTLLYTDNGRDLGSSEADAAEAANDKGTGAREQKATTSTGPVTASVAAAPSSAALSEEDADHVPMDETSSLMSRTSSLPGDVLVQNSVDMDRSHRIDIRGWKLLSNIEFWQLFSIMGILSGIGLMTINNIGHDANALWKHYDSSVPESLLVQRQQMHVAILSIGSFVGRLLSGVGSDFLVKRMEASRVWCLVIAASVFIVAQLLALTIVNPHFLALVSSLSGLGYGFLFGVFPSIVAESFGIHGLSQNWGFMTLSPIVSGNVFNLFYGSVFDRHTVTGPDGERSCPDGIECYRAAYVATLGACGLGLVVTLLVIRHQYLQRLKDAGKRSLED
ncbi:major facilitator superfamily transporter [Grosmannia clavigera kw1407]|uniref:Major facilitator superfamily transporter n=1 Tax=Grosmannia clavigera (strain kw1407 / UAMH 11150) TaxID=655863 RepID=F0XFV4_GROCL|nr:major facilitator superfamily transporter [Grosmannia clavigera kw1407]EFX04675.1 major facilitator superfamily transporter [Grosmannia clavigera kw1407]